MSTERNDTDFLRFIAIIFIINSHLDNYYPVQALATGGHLGNSLFFMLSAFGLFLSQKAKQKPFINFYSRRIERIYPSVWLATLFLKIPLMIFFTCTFYINYLLYYFRYFFYPDYWFLQFIMVIYFFSFFITTKYSRRKIYIAFAIFIVAYLTGYFLLLDIQTFSIETMPFRMISYSIVFLLGLYFADNNDKIRYSGFIDIIIFALSFIIIYGHKFLLARNFLPELQIFQHIFTFVLLLYSLKISRSRFVSTILMNSPVGNVIRFISGITLELYIVHSTISPIILELKLIFPLNVIALITISFIITLILNKLKSILISLQIFKGGQIIERDKLK